MIDLSSTLRQAARIGSVAIVSALALAGTVTAAQDEESHPAHIHVGTCETLGDVVVPLTDVAVLTGESSGPASSVPVKISETTVDLPLQAIIDGGHAINVHESAETIDVYIACGNIGGVVDTTEGDSDSELVIGLGELNDSGHHGVAWLGADGDRTHVVVYLIEPAESGTASAEAAQDAGAADAESLAVEIKGFAFNPPTTTVPTGGSVTWTNQDNAPHTATGIERDVLQSGPITFGESFSQTFDTAGSYDYFCEFHAGMKGTIVVE